MEKLVKTEFLSLLSELSSVTTEQMKNAYESFLKEVETLNHPATDFQTIFRTLNITRIEFKTLQAQILCEQGEKCS